MHLEATERGIGDTLLLLVVHMCHQLYGQTRERRHLVDAIVLLENALHNFSKHNFQFR
jgi:hypothetical protein